MDPSLQQGPGRPPAAPSARAATGALLLFAAVAGLFKVKSYDVFWHLASGRWIVGHGGVPRTDPFRFTSHGTPWVDHEWLFQTLLYSVERLAGLNGLIVARAALAVTVAAILLVVLRRAGAPAAWAVFPVLVAVLGFRPRLFLRPELATLLCLSLLLLLLEELRRAGGRRRHALAAGIVALAVPWANAHPGALAAPIVAGAFLLGSRLPGGRPREWHRPTGDDARASSPIAWRPIPWPWVFGLPALMTLALLATPNGWHILAVPTAIGSSLRGLNAVNPEWLPLWKPSIARASVYLFAAAAALVTLALVTLRRTRRLDPATGLAAAALAALASTSIRHQALFYVGAAVLAGECLADLARSRSPAAALSKNPARPRRTAHLATVLCLLAVAWALVPPSRGPLAPNQGLYHPGFGLQPGRFPTGLADRVAEWTERLNRPAEPGEPLGPLYNNVAWGGYLLWRLYPPRQVFLDGRNEVDPELLRALDTARRSNDAWSSLMSRYGVDGAVVRYDERRLDVLDPPERPGGRAVESHHTPHSVFFPRDEYALVAWDDVGMLLVKRTAARAALLARTEYRAVRPEDWRWMLERTAVDPAYRAEVLAEVERRLAEGSPESGGAAGAPCTRAERLREVLAEQSRPPGP